MKLHDDQVETIIEDITEFGRPAITFRKSDDCFESYELNNYVDNSFFDEIDYSDFLSEKCAEKIANIILSGNTPAYISHEFVRPFFNVLSMETAIKLWVYLRKEIFDVTAVPSKDDDIYRDLYDYLIISQYLKR